MPSSARIMSAVDTWYPCHLGPRPYVTHLSLLCLTPGLNLCTCQVVVAHMHTHTSSRGKKTLLGRLQATPCANMQLHCDRTHVADELGSVALERLIQLHGHKGAHQAALAAEGGAERNCFASDGSDRPPKAAIRSREGALSEHRVHSPGG
jgi:hypothetical protein